MPDLVLYDGGCGLCHRSVAFLARRDRDGSLFVFAPLGGPTATVRLVAGGDGPLPSGTVAVLDETGRLRTRSDAVLHALDRLGGGWRVVAGAMKVVPDLSGTASIGPWRTPVGASLHRHGERALACPLTSPGASYPEPGPGIGRQLAARALQAPE
ncbi:MAG: DUF393 domain-containing protein [Holophagales bacterium]|nr:DUF393 domain-containing protein [Holophagales bacterium]